MYKAMLVDDHQLFREGLKSLLAGMDDIEVIGEASTGKEAVELALQLLPDFILMDISMPDMNGIEATEIIKKSLPETFVLALSMNSDKVSVKSMLQAGASGYVLKSNAFEDISLAIKTIIAGKVFITDEIKDLVFEDYTTLLQSDPNEGHTALTDRETEILKLISEGYNSKEIGEICFISGSTVDSHRKKIMQKLEINSIAELTKYAIKEGITKLE